MTLSYLDEFDATWPIPLSPKQLSARKAFALKYSIPALIKMHAVYRNAVTVARVPEGW